MPYTCLMPTGRTGAIFFPFDFSAYFSVEETAAVLYISNTTVERDWEFALVA